MSLLSTHRQLELMRELQRAASERHADEERIAAERKQALEEAAARRDRRRRDVDEAHEAERDGVDSDYGGRRSMLDASHEAERSRAQGEYRSRRTKAEAHAAKTAKLAAEERKEAAWEILTLYDSDKDKPPQKREKLRKRVAAMRADLAAIASDAVAITRARGLGDADFEFATPDKSAPDADEAAATDEACESVESECEQAVERARDAAQALYDQRLAGLLDGPIPAGAFVGMLVTALPPAGFAFGWADWRAYAIGVGAAALAALAAYLVCLPRVRRQTRDGFDASTEALRDAERACDQAVSLAVARAKHEADALQKRRDADLQELGFRLDELIGKASAESAAEVEEISQTYPAMLAEMREKHDAQIAEFEGEHAAKIAELTRRRDERIARIEADHESDTKTIAEDAEAEWQRMFERWLTQYDDVRAELRDMRADCQRLFPDFATTDYTVKPPKPDDSQSNESDAEEEAAGWSPPTEPPPAIAFGTATLDLKEVNHGLSDDERLHPPEQRLEAPALMTLAEHPTLLLTATGEGRRRGVELLRLMMLRFLTAMPPGKVRFTILDPVGLGENFQAFMHLADIDDQLIAGRIWSEPRDIDEQLSRLTNHMETVLQKYLRSEYETIHEYNASAGEVAEPFQVLVAAGFPVNFGESAARRLVSLVTGGPRCGVYTMLGVDTEARMPTDFRLDELKTDAAWLDWQKPEGDPEAHPEAKEPRFVWRHPGFEELELDLAPEPPVERTIDVIRKAGVAAKAAVKVEVPFSIVEPEPDKLWTATCDDELSVPIGRAGAKNLQHVRLGKGTSQHLLVAGKTGSGKSTFLHALVTSAAMHFSPDEVEFYLVDFKKGVEFKSYATHRLPHARVIAIESEREFGLSVLERLDEELRVRGERFRDAGVQNLADYRRARPDEKTPRILLIVDEFQELFVEDDRLAQESSLLMDRLVRQGRAFGMHVLLGTQTLAGAYSIARSTLGQIAIRVALECSEADAHLILSDERNTAARFLSRPGEAIYNAQNGLVTANEPFQVVWLPDRDRSGKLDALDEHRHNAELPPPATVVFEGNAPADPEKNEPLNRLLAGEAEPLAAGRAAPAWIGAAVAIKPPTYVEFGRHPGTNLLLVGPQETAALGMLSAAVVSLAAGEPDARVIVFDGARPGEEGAGVWARVADAMPGGATLVDQRSATATVAELAEELASREAAASDPDAPTPPAIYVVLHNAGRFRELRKRDDDFSFGMSSDEPKKPDAQFAELVRNGPALGIHVLAWCDSYNSVTRIIDRQMMREFALRVALQMSAADSSHLLDSPAASDLKLHRALFYNDETGQAEKFRPYGMPSEAWLARVAEANPVADAPG